MKTNKFKAILGLIAILVLSSSGLYYLNNYRSSADTVTSASTSTDSDNSTANSQANANATADLSNPSTVNNDTSATDSSLESNVASPGTSTTGTVSANQSTAILDKECIASGGNDFGTIDMIIRDEAGNILIGGDYKPQVNVNPLTAITGKITNVADGEWTVEIKSGIDQQVVTKVGSQGILISTLTLNFSSSCPVATADTNTVEPVTTQVDTGTQTTAPKINNTKTASSGLKTNIIYLIGAAILFIMILAGGILIFLKRRQNQVESEVDKTTESPETPIPPQV
jgi:hypothetical protein